MRAVGAELGGVGAAVDGQRCDGLLQLRPPDLDRAVPGAGQEGLLRDEVPVHREDFARVLLPRLDGEVVQ